MLPTGFTEVSPTGISPSWGTIANQHNRLQCFSAISGSSTATAAAIGTVSLPQLKAQGYNPTISTGSLAAGGTRNFNSSSIPLIIYSTFAEISAAKLFIAGILPGLLLVVLFCGFLALANSFINREASTKKSTGQKIPWLMVFNDLFPFLLLIVLVLGSIYAGIATPTEAAAVGCLGAAVVGKIWGNLSYANFRAATGSTVKTTGAIMLIVMMALVFSYAVAITGLPKQLANWVGTQEMSTITLILFLGSVYLVMGCIIDSIGMMVITVPLFLPIVEAVGIDPVLFGIMVVIFIEIGLITPPIGLNLFVIHSLDPDGQLLPIIKGAVPFVIIMILMALLLWNFPARALWLPSRM